MCEILCCRIVPDVSTRPGLFSANTIPTVLVSPVFMLVFLPVVSVPAPFTVHRHALERDAASCGAIKSYSTHAIATAVHVGSCQWRGARFWVSLRPSPQGSWAASASDTCGLLDILSVWGRSMRAEMLNLHVQDVHVNPFLRRHFVELHQLLVDQVDGLRTGGSPRGDSPSRAQRYGTARTDGSHYGQKWFR